MKNKVITYLKKNYSKGKICKMIEDEINDGDYIEEENENLTRKEKIQKYFKEDRNEVEKLIREKLEKELMERFGFNYENYLLETGEELWETLIEEYSFLS